MPPRPEGTDAERREFYAEISPYHLAPMWEKMHELITREPTPRAVPHLWRYAQVRPRLLTAADMISQQDAERRTLMLENPALRGEARISDALYAGLQLIMPGEVAAPHRHTPSAMRMVFESEGAYSSIAGERCDMRPGDLILNQSWLWHGHAHEGAGPHISMTCLDTPIVKLFGAVFGEPPVEAFEEGAPQGDELARFGATMLPMGHEARHKVSPLSRYPYDRTRAALAPLVAGAPLDPCHGAKRDTSTQSMAGRCCASGGRNAAKRRPAPRAEGTEGWRLTPSVRASGRPAQTLR
jgi:gentisate 1,2-dioxygenase